VNRSTQLFATDDLAIHRFDHPAEEVHHDPDDEVAEGWSIAFVTQGRFTIGTDQGPVALGVGGAFITRPGLSFRCRHPEPCPDDVCLSINFAPHAVGVADEAWARAGWVARRIPTPRLALVQGRLAEAARHRDTFQLERWGLAGLTALLSDTRGASRRGPYAPRRDDLDAVLATCRAIESAPAERRTIAARAREVGMTGPQLTHAFRRYLGVSPHRYVVRWRLREATCLLDAGASVSASCWRSGFENLSHYTRSFRRAFDLLPSAWSRLPVVERRRKVQALLHPAR
jgi:AraC-like DNA-binding protein